MEGLDDMMIGSLSNTEFQVGNGGDSDRDLSQSVPDDDFVFHDFLEASDDGNCGPDFSSFNDDGNCGLDCSSFNDEGNCGPDCSSFNDDGNCGSDCSSFNDDGNCGLDCSSFNDDRNCGSDVFNDDQGSSPDFSIVSANSPPISPSFSSVCSTSTSVSTVSSSVPLMGLVPVISSMSLLPSVALASPSFSMFSPYMFAPTATFSPVSITSMYLPCVFPIENKSRRRGISKKKNVTLEDLKLCVNSECLNKREGKRKYCCNPCQWRAGNCRRATKRDAVKQKARKDFIAVVKAGGKTEAELEKYRLETIEKYDMVRVSRKS